MKNVWTKILAGLIIFFAGALTWMSIFPRTKIEINGKYKPIARKGGMNITKDIYSAINTKKSLKKAKNDKNGLLKRVFTKKNKKS